ncbi:hypothetical protein BGZ81_003199 [Podila clonocystis]|nr:hypothetical protein BGZ81_003199 [Podila clonocystis]
MSSTNSTIKDDATQQLEADASISAFTSALLFNGCVGLAIFVVFCIVRHWNRKIYQPRTYLVPAEVRSPVLPTGIFSWVTSSFKVTDNELLDRIGLDAYMYLRFLRMSAILFGGFTLIAIPILIPINVINGVGSGGLGDMTIGNVAQAWRFWFHLILTIVFCAASIVMLWREMYEYTRRRHAYLLSDKHAKTPQSSTILITALPKGLNSEEALYNIFKRFEGGPRKIWLNKDPKNLIKLCEERDNAAMKLEAAEYNYIRSAYGKRTKKDPEVKEPQRPLGKVATIPGLGDKVDLIEFYTKQLSELNQEVEKAQNAIDDQDVVTSAFIQFHTQFAAHSAVQTVVHPTPFQMTPMFAEISPLDVNWNCMNIKNVERKGRRMASLAAASALVLLWSIPVFFVGSIANLASLVKIFGFLSFLLDLPPAVTGIIQGILPPLFLGILMALLPIILTMMSQFEGHVRYSSVTLAVMSKYFFFLVVNVLLISALTGGFLATWGEIENGGFSPIDVINILSEKLPKTSTFFCTYAMLQGLTGPVKELLQIAPLVLNYIFTKVLAKSPRQIWNVQGRLGSVNYGTLFPPQTLMFCIGILFSTIAPLVLPFVTFYFTMYYFVYRHQFLYVYQQPVESGGLAFPLAVKQAYAGIFIFEITVFGIFLLKQSKLPVLPQLIMMLITIVATILSLVNMNEAFNPLVTFLPAALFSKDLHVDADGVVQTSQDLASNEKRKGTGVDEEASFNEKSPVILGNTSITPSVNIAFSRGEKQEFDESGTVSSQLPGIPTPNPSELDAASYSRHEVRPVPTTDHAGSFTSGPAYVGATAEQDARASVDPELQKLQDQAYLHPAMYKQQVPIWLPEDERGLVREEILKLSQQGIVVATDGAGIDALTGKAHVSDIIYAPGEESRYRLERGI